MAIGSAPQPNIIGLDTSKEINEKLSLRVLLAEDTKSLRETVAELLEAREYKVVAVENGQLLMDKLLEEGANFDLIITDNQMPEKNGLVALQEIRSNSDEKLNKLPVILMTTDDYGGALRKKLEDLGAGFLSKPFSIEELYNKIDELTQKPESIK